MKVGGSLPINQPVSETRRNSVRLNVGLPGQLRFASVSASCIVVDISPTGARVRLTPPRLVPDRVTLETTLAGQPVSVPAQLRRAQPGTLVSLTFEPAWREGLERLVAQAYALDLERSGKGIVERRQLPR